MTPGRFPVQKTLVADNWLFIGGMVFGLVVNPIATIAGYLIIGLIMMIGTMIKTKSTLKLGPGGIIAYVLMGPFVLYHGIIIAIEYLLKEKRS